MAKSVLLLLGSLLVLMVVAEARNGLASVVEEKAEPGGFVRINMSEPTMQELVKIVVAIYNWQEGSQLQLKEAKCGWSQIVEGDHYVFCLSVTDDGNNKVLHYKTNVFVDLDKNIFIKDFHTQRRCCHWNPPAY